MDERARRSREIQDRIGRILYEDWDPLGLRGVAPSDEYDSYIGGVYRMLAASASCELVAAHRYQENPKSRDPNPKRCNSRGFFSNHRPLAPGTRLGPYEIVAAIRGGRR
jgi:hypothetical protein